MQTKGVYSALILLLMFFFITGVTNALANDRQRETLKPVGTMVDTGAYKAHVVKQGSGEQLVVLISECGTPSAYTDFYMLQKNLSDKYTTIVYDHAGTGFSGERNNDSTLENLVADLEKIVAKYYEGDQIVLVCHSSASLEAIGFAQSHPDKVKGIVFLDAGSPEYYSTESELSDKLANDLNAVISFTGLPRLFGQVGRYLSVYGQDLRGNKLTKKVQDLDEEMYYLNLGDSSINEYISYRNENANTVLQGNRLQDIPILVLSADSSASWDEVQKQLLDWSNNGKRVILPDSEHYIHWSNTDKVNELVKDFVGETVKVEQTGNKNNAGLPVVED